MSSTDSTDNRLTETQSADDQWRRVLAIDTATRTQSLALFDGETVLEHSQRRVKFNHGSTLLSHLNGTLDEHKLDVSDLDLIAVGVGPGSFTGLRVGLAIAKSLARAEDIPLVGVSTLAALAYPVASAHRTATVWAMNDARRQEVYAGSYTHDGPHLTELEADYTSSPEAMRERVLDAATTSSPIILVGNGLRKYDVLADWDTPNVTVMPAWADGPSGIGLVQLGRQKAARGEFADIGSLEPNYIRPTDAELNYKG